MNAYGQLLRERGIGWFWHRSLYSAKLKLLRLCPPTERFFEKKAPRPERLELFTVDTEALRAFLFHLPDTQKSDIIAQANDACRGKLLGFSSLELDYGYPIDWQKNPLTGERVDARRKWYEIPDFDNARGDIKVVWEASRFSHFFLLARAYLLTEDESYVRAYAEQITAWLEANPYSYGANFKCGQECALRMLSCLLVYPVFAPLLTETDLARIRELIHRSYRKILSNFSYAYKCQNNNHTLSELAGMIAGAWCCHDDRRMKWAYKTLDRVIDAQFTEDGGYIQQSFNYQRVALQDMEAILKMRETTGLSPSEHSLEKLRKSALLMYQCQDVSGDMPNYGSNDGALIFPVTSCGYRDFTPCIHTVYALLTGRRLYDGGLHDEELLWLGPNGATLSEREVFLRVSSQFPKAGLYTLRGDRFWLMLAAKTTINHMDQNHIDVWVDGQNILCDSGTYSYADELGRRLFSTGAHNTLLCSGREQINRVGAFAVYGQPTLGYTSADAHSISTEITFSSGYTHRRAVRLLPEGFEVRDEWNAADGVSHKGVPAAHILFHTPAAPLRQSDTEVRLQDICRLVTETPVQMEETVRSLYYLRQEPITCLSVPAEQQASTTTKILFK